MSKDAALALVTGQNATEGTPGLVPQPEKEETTPPKLDSERFAALAKRETDFVKKQQLLKQEREAFEKERDALKPIAEQYREYQALKGKDPVAALKLMGFSETDIINFLAAEAKEEPSAEERAAQAAAKVTEEKIKEFEAAQAKKEAAAIQERDAKTIQAFRADIAQAIESDKDKYEYCAHYGQAAEELAYAFTCEVVRQSKGLEVITAQEAIQMVEEYYEEQDQAMNALKKRKPKEAPADAAAEGAQPPERTRTVTPGNPSAQQPKAPLSKVRESNGAVSAASARARMSETREQKRERLKSWLATGVKQ